MMAMSKKVRKAVIPAAGLGTRFLPATKAMPKEMLPIVDKPIIQYVVEEAVASGIEEIIIVTGWNKRSIEDHFDYPFELEKRLLEVGKAKEAEEVRNIANLANFVYIRQKGPYGNGTPVLNAKSVIGDEPGIFKINSIVEKPGVGEAPSNLATHGAYIMTPRLFEILEETPTGKNGELWLVDAISALAKEQDVYAVEIQNGKYYDTGNKLEYLKTVVEFGLKHPDLNGDFRDFIKDLKL